MKFYAQVVRIYAQLKIIYAQVRFIYAQVEFIEWCRERKSLEWEGRKFVSQWTEVCSSMDGSLFLNKRKFLFLRETSWRCEIMKFCGVRGWYERCEGMKKMWGGENIACLRQSGKKWEKMGLSFGENGAVFWRMWGCLLEDVGLSYR